MPQLAAALLLATLASGTVAFELVSKAFDHGENLPAEFLADEDNISPPLEFKNAPSGTKSFALIVDDADAPKGEGTHWLLYDIPAEKTTLAEDISSGDGVSKVVETLTNKPPPPPPGGGKGGMMGGGMGGMAGMAGMMGGGAGGGMMGGGMGGMMGGGMMGGMPDMPDGPNVITAHEGQGSFGKNTWSGPSIQKKAGNIKFKAYALTEKLGLDAGASRAEVLAAMKGKVLAKSNLVGTVPSGVKKKIKKKKKKQNGRKKKGKNKKKKNKKKKGK